MTTTSPRQWADMAARHAATFLNDGETHERATRAAMMVAPAEVSASWRIEIKPAVVLVWHHGATMYVGRARRH